MGIKLYNKLPPALKNLEKVQDFRYKVKQFLIKHMFYWVGEFLSARWDVAQIVKVEYNLKN